ncbi:hypothetical protein BD769DRAFT_1658239 [Suillus cothurnatus]|nr:hypothetical protein BD769DRAFT_1658239 [Suillus cothurnatus]
MSNIIISPCDTPLNVDVLGIEHNENDLVYWLQVKGREILPDSLFTTASVLFGLVDPLDIKALIEVRLKEDATQTGLQHEEESCLEYLKRGGRFLMEERMDRAQIEVSLFSRAIANLCEELNTRYRLALRSVDPEKLVTPKPAESVGARQTSVSDNCFRPTKAIQGKCHAWLRTSPQSQDITQDSNASRILRDFPLTSQIPRLHEHVLRKDHCSVALLQTRVKSQTLDVIKKLVTPKPAESVGARQTSVLDNCFQPTKAVQDKCHAWLCTSSQSQDITQDSNASRILHDFPLTSQCPCLHEHVLRPDDQFIPLPRVMKTWVDNFTYGAYINTSLAESNKPLPLDIGNSFTSKELKPLEMLKSDFHILDLKKQRAQSEVDMLSEAIVRISEFHHNDDGTTDTDESDSPDAWSDDWMSTSSPSSSSLLLS